MKCLLRLFSSQYCETVDHFLAISKGCYFFSLLDSMWRSVQKIKYYQNFFLIMFGRETVAHWTGQHISDYTMLPRAFGEYQVLISSKMFYCHNTKKLTCLSSVWIAAVTMLIKLTLVLFELRRRPVFRSSVRRWQQLWSSRPNHQYFKPIFHYSNSIDWICSLW